jgi:hypothetical protein
MENNTFKVPEGNLGWLKEKIEKLNRRATKLSMPLIELLVLGEEVTQICKCQILPCVGTCPYRKYIKVEIKGQAPSIDGWDFVGTVAHIEEGSNILQLLPGQTVPESYRQADPKNCDHCHTKRNRASTYILINAKNEYKQVGKQCLQDFFKQDVANVVARAELLAAAGQLQEASESFGGSGSSKQYYKLSDYLANVLAVVEKCGFTSRTKASETGKNPTSLLAGTLMITPSATGPGTVKQEIGQNISVTPEHEAKAVEIIAWVETYLDKPTLSDYEHNLKVVVDLGYCDWRTFGLAASITALHYRETAAKAEKTAKKPSEYVGEVGKRMKGLTLTLVKITNLGEGEFGMRYLYRFVDTNENVLVWFTGNVLDADTREWFENTVYTGAVSVKEHSEYKGIKQTVITRCKLFSPELRAKFDAKEPVK